MSVHGFPKWFYGAWRVGGVSILPEYDMGDGIPYIWLPNFGPVEQHTDLFPIKDELALGIVNCIAHKSYLITEWCLTCHHGTKLGSPWWSVKKRKQNRVLSFWVSIIYLFPKIVEHILNTWNGAEFIARIDWRLTIRPLYSQSSCSLEN
jgi:hypothetical protein